MIDAKSAEEAFKIVLDSEYVKSSDDIDSINDYELLLSR